MSKEASIEELRNDVYNLKVKLITTLAVIGEPRMNDIEKSLIVELVKSVDMKCYVARSEVVVMELKHALYKSIASYQVEDREKRENH
jgi:hypothetical protein